MSIVTVKAVTNNQRTKLNFVEADCNFVDILFSFLTLPLGKMAKLLEEKPGPAVGSLNNLYISARRLDGSFFVNGGARDMLLNPRTMSEDVCPNLKLDSEPVQYFTCDRSYYCGSKNRPICMYCDQGACDSCGRGMYCNLEIMDTKDGDRLGFTANAQLFVVHDDLRVEPYALGFLQTVRNFDMTDMKAAVQQEFHLWQFEIIRLLRLCLLSETPLTDLLLKSSDNPSSPAQQSSPKIPLKTQKTEVFSSKYINLKITLQKSTNKLLFVQAGADFVELLFSFLTIPLGGVLSILDGNACNKNVENLYKSLAAMDMKFFRTPDLKSRLVNPKLAPGYGCRKQFLPLSEEAAPELYTFDGKFYYKKHNSKYVSAPYKTPKGSDNYVKERTSYTVADDLTVKPFVLTSGVEFLDELKISLSDVDELEVRIGMEEVLGILRASLTSTSALSTGLINHMPKKVPKVEQQLVGKIV